MKDSKLKQDVIDELNFEPSVDAADIGVAVEDGIATLTGHVPTYAQKDLSSLGSANRLVSGDLQLQMIGRITMSLNTAKDKLGDKPTAAMLDELLAKHFPGFTLDKDLRELVLAQRPLERNAVAMPQHALARMIARQTGYYWGTGGHTPEPVVIGAMGPGAQTFRGYQDNTEVGKRIQQLIAGGK